MASDVYSWADVSLGGMMLPGLPKAERLERWYVFDAPIPMTVTDVEQHKRWVMMLIEQPCTPLPCRDTCSPGEAIAPMLARPCT